VRRHAALALFAVPLAAAGLVVSGAAPASAPSFASVIPKPLADAPERGAFTLESTTRIVAADASPEAIRVARLLAGALRPATGLRLPVTRARRGATGGSIVLSLAPGDRSLGDEGYRLRVGADEVTLTARRPAGLFWGTQTLRQLLPAAIETGSRVDGPWRIPQGTIHDGPRFAWRGMMLDVARHFFGVDEVKRLIDLMALYKLNRLHLHLTDDQGWRIAIRSWPRLTRVGGQTAVNGGPGGFYTQRQYRTIVAYAKARFVEVVPEVDMPGHVNAALASYGRLTCDGKAPVPYTGIDVGFSSLCIHKEITYRFLDDVIGEVAALTPGPYIHIGGDEAHSTDPSDYRRFVERVQQIVRAHGKRMLGWEEIARVRLRRTSVAQHWQDPALARKAVEQGAKVVMSPATKAYLDMKYTPSYPLGLVWAGTTSVRDAYEWDPAMQVDGVPEKSILGVEAALWSETIETRAGIDALAFPRLLGIAEIAWSPAAGRSWREYRTRLAAQEPRLAALGVAFHASPEVPRP
jgi:hexosaminidase